MVNKQKTTYKILKPDNPYNRAVVIYGVNFTITLYNDLVEEEDKILKILDQIIENGEIDYVGKTF
jgi:hypothetical protein